MPKKYKHKSRGKTMNYDRDKLTNAVDAVKNGRLSLRKASKEYNVPKSTISDILHEKYASPGKPGRRTALPEVVEGKIVNTLKQAAKQGIGVSRKQLLTRVGTLCRKLNATPFKNTTPGKDWWQGVKKRHPELSIRKPEKLTTSRASMLNSAVLERYFLELGNLLNDLGLNHKPKQIWNCDETGKQFEHQPVKVIAEKGSRSVVGRTTENRANITVMACVNALGEKMPPLMIVKGKTSASLYGFNVESAPKGTKWDIQKNGWMSDAIGEKWFKEVFLVECGPERPQLLILDGHSSHETLAVIELAMEENIYVFSLPPHCTHALQPLDRTVFKPLNSAYDEVCSEYLNQNSLNLVNKWTFPGLFKLAWEKALTPANICSGFRACGIYPFNPSAVATDMLKPSLPTETPLAASKEPVHGVDPEDTGVSVSSSNFEAIAVIHPVPENYSSGELYSTELSTAADIEHQAPNHDIIETITVDTQPPTIEDPEMLLELINSGKCELFSANEDGVATIENISESDIWNKAINDIFLPPQEHKPKSTNKRKRQTSHRLLTSENILSEKRELARNKELKEKEKLERKLRREMKEKQKLQNEIKRGIEKKFRKSDKENKNIVI